MKSLIAALSFLTPIPFTAQLTTREFSKIQLWFSLIGFLQGSALMFACFGLSFVVGRPVVSVLAMCFWAFLTNATHLDGVADCFDGFPNPSNPKRRLEIMSDPRTGAFGVVGIVLILILKAALVTSSKNIGWMAFVPILAAMTFARGSVLILTFFRSAKESGLGHSLCSGRNIWFFLINMIIPVTLAVFLRLPGLIALVTSFVATIIVGFVAKARISGVTGDVFGLAIEVSEVSVLLSFAVIEGIFL